MNIFPVSIEDIDSLKQVARITIEKSIDLDKKLKSEIIDESYKHIENNIATDGNVFIKLDENGIRGFILVQNFWNLSDLFVLPEFHCRGIGSSLFKTALDVCKEQSDKPGIRVNSSLNAVDFYRKLGFIDYIPQKKCPNYVHPLVFNF